MRVGVEAAVRQGWDALDRRRALRRHDGVRRQRALQGALRAFRHHAGKSRRGGAGAFGELSANASNRRERRLDQVAAIGTLIFFCEARRRAGTAVSVVAPRMLDFRLRIDEKARCSHSPPPDGAGRCCDKLEDRDDGGKGCDQRVRAHRAQRPARHRRVRPQGHRGRRDQRSRPGRDQRPSAALRQRARPLPARGHGRRRHDQRRRRQDQGDGDQGSRRSCRTRRSASTSRSNAPASSPRATRPRRI